MKTSFQKFILAIAFFVFFLSSCYAAREFEQPYRGWSEAIDRALNFISLIRKDFALMYECEPDHLGKKQSIVQFCDTMSSGSHPEVCALDPTPNKIAFSFDPPSKNVLVSFCHIYSLLGLGDY